MTMTEDITFCANQNCTDMKCMRNPAHIKLRIPHSFALFSECPNWNDNGAKWFTKQVNDIFGGNNNEENSIGNT